MSPTRSSACSGRSTSASSGPRLRSGCLPVRSQHDRPGTLFPGDWPLEARRDAAQANARVQASAEEYRQVPERARPERRVRRRPIRDVIVRDDVSVAPRLRRRRQLRPADRLRQRRQPAARPRDRPPPRDRDPGRDRRLARPHHPAAAHRERAALARRRRARADRRRGWDPRAATVNTAGLPRVGENGDARRRSTGVSSAFALLVSLATGIIFGLIPALQSSKTDLTTTLKESSGRSGTGFRQNKARAILVVVEVALALVLLIGSALLIRTAMALGARRTRVRHAQRADDEDVAQGRAIREGGSRRAGRAQRRRELRTMPGVVNASATCCVPLQGGYGLPFRIVGRPLAATARDRSTAVADG